MNMAFFSVKELAYLDNGPYSIDVCENCSIGLTGASGIGKTQFLRALVGAIPYTGDIYLDGVSCLDFAAPQWRRKVALVPAESAWWRDSVGEHFPGTSEGIDISGCLRELGFGEEILQWRVSRLSTGEKQRLALCRALALEPSILLLDEPCSALDENSTGLVEQLLAQYKSRPKTALVWVSHDLEQLRRVSERCCRLLPQELAPL